MDTNNDRPSTLNLNAQTLLDAFVNAIADSVMQKVATRLATIKDDLHEVIAQMDQRLTGVEKRMVAVEDRLNFREVGEAEPGANVAALITRIAVLESSLKEASERLDHTSERLDTVEGSVDDHQSRLDEVNFDDFVTDDRVNDVVSDELGNLLPDAVAEQMGDYVKSDDLAEAIADNLPDDVVRQQALEDAVGTAVSKLRIVVGD